MHYSIRDNCILGGNSLFYLNYQLEPIVKWECANEKYVPYPLELQNWLNIYKVNVV